MSYQCDKCGATIKDRKIVVQWSDSLENESKTYIFCPKCYEEEAINAFNTYIDDKDMIPVLLGYDWMIWKDTWTDCPMPTYKAIKKAYQHNGNATLFGELY